VTPAAWKAKTSSGPVRFTGSQLLALAQGHPIAAISQPASPSGSPRYGTAEDRTMNSSIAQCSAEIFSFFFRKKVTHF
jgi:hypothetical protein